MAKKSAGQLQLQEVLKKRQITVREAGDLIGCNGSSISYWATGRGKPKILHALKMQTVFGIRIEDW